MSMIRLRPVDSTHTWKTVYRNYFTDDGVSTNVMIKLYHPDTKETDTLEPLTLSLSNGILTTTFSATLKEGLTYRLTLEQSEPDLIRIARVLALCTKQSDLANYTPFSGQTINAPDGDNTFITIP